jgi:hypothetical protein
MSPFFAMSFFVAVLFCGVTLDVGNMELTRMQLQNAADAAAIGGQVSHDEQAASASGNALLDAQTNGFTNGVNNVTVSINVGAATGPYAGRYDVVTATVTKQINTLFMGTLNGGKITLSASAYSVYTPCVFLTGAHSPSLTSYPLSLNTGSSIGNWGGTSHGCPIEVNKGIYADSNSSLWVNQANVVGSSSGSSLMGGIYHTPSYNATAFSDPLTYTAACTTLSANCVHQTSTGITPPSFSSCTYTGKTWASGGTYTLSPGTYCSSFSFTNSTVTLLPGLYIITGGGTWSGSTVTGTGVTLYFTQKGDNNYGQFKVTSSTLTLSAPTTSTNSSIPGILFMNDKNWVPTAAQDFQFLSGSGNTGDGIYYFIGTGVMFNSSPPSATNYMCFDVDNMNIIATAVNPLSNFAVIPTGNPFNAMIGGLIN